MPDHVHRLGLGLAAVARPAYITSGRDALGATRSVDELRARTTSLLDAAYAAGVRYLDVARSYGRAEEFLAGWLADRPEIDSGTDGVEVGSKWGYRYVGDWRLDADVHETKDHSLAAYTEQVAQSRALLGDRLDVYHVHSATPESGILDDDGVHRAMAALRDEGVRVGISTSGPAQPDVIRRALAIEVGGEPLFTSYQSTWNPLEPSAVALAERAGVPLDRLAVAAALANPWAWRVLLGPVEIAQLESNLAGAVVEPPDGLDDLPETAERYWTTRSARPWA